MHALPWTLLTSLICIINILQYGKVTLTQKWDKMLCHNFSMQDYRRSALQIAVVDSQTMVLLKIAVPKMAVPFLMTVTLVHGNKFIIERFSLLGGVHYQESHCSIDYLIQ